MALIVPAVLVTLRLEYGEFVVRRTFCPWCAISTVTITLNAVLVLLDWRRVRGEAVEDVPGGGTADRRGSCLLDEEQPRIARMNTDRTM